MRPIHERMLNWRSFDEVQYLMGFLFYFILFLLKCRGRGRRNLEASTFLTKPLTPSYWLQGGFVVAISKTVHPRLQKSTARLLPLEFRITWANNAKENQDLLLRNVA